MGHGGDVIDELTYDHREVDDLFARIEQLAPGDPERKHLMDQLTIELVRHSVAEEQYLYPAARQFLDGGDEIVDREIADHASVERMLKEIEGLEVDDPQFNRLVIRLKAEIAAHLRDEEENLFVQLRRTCDAKELNDLGDRIRAAKKVAPTRPHPDAPSTPPGNRLLGPGIGLVDRARDFVTGRGR